MITAQGNGWVITGGTAPAPATLACSTAVSNGSLTAQKVIADLEAMLLIDGIKNIVPGGTSSTDDASILDNAAIDLANYSGSQLANDASQFVSDEQSYNPSGAVDGAYATAVLRDIRHLLRTAPVLWPRASGKPGSHRLLG